jgi:phosphatidylethanolamine/phosphatidyl-N-methylethanolamine N-methyltransferase
MIAREYTKFISEFVCHPKAVGAVAPSSSSLARQLVESVDWPNTAAVVEYGPGTGSITEEILGQLPPTTMFLAIEISSRFAEMLRTRFPGLCICEGSVSAVKDHCAANGVGQVDAIVSGLPWASFSEEDQTDYLNATMQVLRPGGQFITYGYLQGLVLPAGRRFRRKLEDYFSEVLVSKPVWANLPPAFYYRCRR